MAVLTKLSAKTIDERVNADKRVIKFCLNSCPHNDCKGVCEELIALKREVLSEIKERYIRLQRAEQRKSLAIKRVPLQHPLKQSKGVTSCE